MSLTVPLASLQLYTIKSHLAGMFKKGWFNICELQRIVEIVESEPRYLGRVMPKDLHAMCDAMHCRDFKNYPAEQVRIFQLAVLQWLEQYLQTQLTEAQLLLLLAVLSD